VNSSRRISLVFTLEDPQLLILEEASMVRKSLGEKALEGIQQIILARGLSPGQKIPTENELTRELGISRGPIREAIKILSALGIVEIRRGDGTYLREDSITSSFMVPIIFRLQWQRQNPVDLIELRMMFEKAIMNLAIQKRLQKDVDLLRASVLRLENLVRLKNPDLKEIVEEDLKFHRLLFESTQNHLIIELGKAIMEFFIPAIERAIDGHRGIISLQHHSLLLKAVESRDMDLAEEAIAMSVQNWKGYLF